MMKSKILQEIDGESAEHKKNSLEPLALKYMKENKEVIEIKRLSNSKHSD